MNVVRPAGFTPAAPSLNILDCGRAALFACAGALAALNAQAGQIANDLSYQNSLLQIANLAGVNSIVWFAMYAVLSIGFSGDDRPCTQSDRVVLALTVVMAMLPVVAAAKVSLEVCALYLLLTSRGGDKSRRIGIVLLGLTGPLLWGRVLLYTFAPQFLSLDAHLVGTAIGSQVHGNVVQFSNSPRAFLIGVPCSSVHNMSLALVLWTTAAALFRLRFDARYICCGAAMVAFMFGLNIFRLSLIGSFPNHFALLHDGAGADLFGWAALLGAGSLVFLGVKGAVERQQ